MSHPLQILGTLVCLLEQVVIIAVGADSMTAARFTLAMVEMWRCDPINRVTLANVAKSCPDHVP
jgi:hypothetical protein